MKWDSYLTCSYSECGDGDVILTETGDEEVDAVDGNSTDRNEPEYEDDNGRASEDKALFAGTYIASTKRVLQDD